MITLVFFGTYIYYVLIYLLYMIVKMVESLKFLITLLAKERHHQKSSEYKCRVVKLCKYQKISKISKNFFRIHQTSTKLDPRSSLMQVKKNTAVEFISSINLFQMEIMKLQKINYRTNRFLNKFPCVSFLQLFHINYVLLRESIKYSLKYVCFSWYNRKLVSCYVI